MRSSQEITAFGKKNIEWSNGMMAQCNRARLAALPNTILFIVQQLHKIFDYGMFTPSSFLVSLWADGLLFSRSIFYRTFNYSFLLMTAAPIETLDHLNLSVEMTFYFYRL